MSHKLIYSLIPVLTRLVIWGCRKLFKTRGLKISFLTVTSLAVISGAAISYYAINRFINGSFK